MPDTFQALWVLLLALLPGAMYTWAYEREVGGWGTNFSDRLLRFVGVSVIFQALISPLTYWLYSKFIRDAPPGGSRLPLWLWPLVMLYVAIPLAAGLVTAHAFHKGNRISRFLLGRAPAPRSWEHLFSSPELRGWVRIRLKSGEWLVGAYSRANGTPLRSYAAGFPNDQDLYLSETVECDSTTGAVELNNDMSPPYRGAGILIRWDEVSFLEFIKMWGSKENV